MSSEISRRSSSHALFTIGEVINRLIEEFPEITISKIRFLETYELVTPTRTSSGYRKFSLADVERLRYILRMQRDHFLPLKVIRGHLDAMDRGLEPPVVGDVTPKPPRALVSTDTVMESENSKAVRLTFEELVEHSESSETLIKELLSFGLISADDMSLFSGRDLAIVKTAKSLADFGLEPRHLKTVKSSAGREIDLFTPLITAARSGRKSASPAEIAELALQISNSILNLHALVLRALLDEQL
ncbi:MAG: MerR family transcriptional regulator [Actinomycetales bacterium]|nr:MerR family transcriptional regulator [Actinomycetales bacterium]